MTDRSDFERRLEARLVAHADHAARPFDAAALAALAKAGDGPHRSFGFSRWLVSLQAPRSATRFAFVGLLLVLALTAGTVIIGAALRAPDPLPDLRGVIVAPTPTPTPPPVADTAPAPVPSQAPIVIMQSSPDPSLTAAGVGVGPCAAMVQLTESWGTGGPGDPVAVGPATTHADGYILMATRDGVLRAFDGSTGVPAKAVTDGDGRIPGIAGYDGLPIAEGGEIVPSPDGRAIAVEEGDLGAAGCGEPFLRSAEGSVLSPFAVRAFQTIRNLVWAPDGTALYGILRATIDAAGNPVTVPGPEHPGPSYASGVVLRWDVQSRQVTDLGNPCPTCWLTNLAVSPDGSNVVVNTAGHATWVRGLDGSWRGIGDTLEMIGWTPDGLMVVDGYDHIDTVDLDGRQVMTSGHICCHGNGYGGLLSPDGTQVVGSTLSADFKARDIVIVDVRDGSQRMIAKMPSQNPNFQCPCEPATVTKVPRGVIVGWAPDGRSLLFLDQGQDPSVATMWSLALDTLTASEPIEVPSHRPPVIAWLPKLR